MNAIRGMMNLSLRGYRTNRGSTSVRRSKPPGQLEIMQNEIMSRDIYEEELENSEDPDEFASDFKNIAEFDRMHEKEMQLQKTKIMTQIVKRKYFKTEEPALLTWGEKEQIRLLHKENPQEWTPDKLSESFPASSDVIVKVLRAKWSVKSPAVVEKYERKVKENWALFKAGKLEVDPLLAEHLAKFKNRQIKTMNREDIAKKIVKPKPVFPDPKSTLFSDIIKSYRTEDPASDEDERIALPEEKTSDSKSFGEIMTNKSTAKRRNKALAVASNLHTERKLLSNKSVTFDQFLVNHVKTVEEKDMTPVDRVLVDEFKRKNTEAYKNKSLVFESESPVAVWKQQQPESDEDEPTNVVNDRLATLRSSNERNRETLMLREDKNNDLVVPKDSAEIGVKLETALEGSIETGIIARHKTGAALSEDYPAFIKIPQTKFKRGATYKVEDRYYDDDGEFLYRVPGLKQ